MTTPAGGTEIAPLRRDARGCPLPFHLHRGCHDNVGGGLRERLAQHAMGAQINSVLVPVLIVVGLALIVLGMLVTRRRRAHYARGNAPPPLMFPVRRGTDGVRTPTPRPATRAHAPAPRVRTDGAAHPLDFAPPSITDDGAGLTMVTNSSYVPNGETVKLQRPLDTAVQLLPGRLQIIAGEDRGQDIRFLRMPGEIPTITLGRDVGPPGRHVRLRASTVSRLHARMQFEDGRWRITNLSQTNPLVLNGEALPSTAGSRILDEGDRIELGEV